MADAQKPSPTIFQRLQHALGGGNSSTVARLVPDNHRYNITSNPNQVVATAKSEAERQQRLLQMQQQRLISKQWIKTNNDISNRELENMGALRYMYYDCDLMDNTMPEIGTALDIFAEESCPMSDDGQMVKVTANSERVKGVLEDLFTNRLAVNTTLPMVARGLCKYGNEYMFLNLSATDGVLGWTQLPSKEMERYDHGMDCPYPSMSNTNLATVDVNQSDRTRFVWNRSATSTYIPYQNWQIAHFRLLYNSEFLPYGVSTLHKARRAFRLLSMMEDAMLMYRLERSVERRVFNIDVGNINEEDVPSYMEQIADSFKRTPVIDPLTGQIDTRKSWMQASEDFFIPRRPGDTTSKIETLPAGQNLTAMDDIKYMQAKIFTALRVPKAFLNFEDEKGDGKNLSLLDVRFTRTVNRIQQSLLMELNKIAIIHLMLLGLKDELTQFKLSMNNPSSQAEMLEIENLAKKVTTAKDAVSDPGGGIPLTSMTWAWKHIMKFSNKEIERMLEDMRLEAALAVELSKTSQIIKRTGLFDTVDNVYGEAGAEYSEGDAEGGPGGDGGPGGGGGGMPPMGDGDFDFGDGGEGEEEVGSEGEMPMGDAAAEDNAPADDNNGNGPAPNLGEAIFRRARAIHEKKVLPKKLQESQSKITQIIHKLSTSYPDKDDKEALFGPRTITEDTKPVDTKSVLNSFVLGEKLSESIDRLTELAGTEPEEIQL